MNNGRLHKGREIGTEMKSTSAFISEMLVLYLHMFQHQTPLINWLTNASAYLLTYVHLRSSGRMEAEECSECVPARHI